MATRFPVLLAHAGCDHTGSVVWEQRDHGHAGGEGGPVLVGLPRGFVSLNAGDGSIDVIDQQGADQYRTNRRISTVDGARTSTFSRDLNLFCLGVPPRDKQAAEIRVFQAK